MVGETDTRKATYAIQVACQAWSKSHETRSCKVSPGRFIPPSRKMQSTQEAIDNKNINAHNDHCVLLVQQIYI